MFRPIRVDHTNCLQVAIKTHSFKKFADVDIDESEYEKAIDEIDKIEHHFKMNINIYTQD